MRSLTLCLIGLACASVAGVGFGQPPARALLEAWRRLTAPDPYAEFVAQTGPRSPEEERQGFHLPPGFEIQLVAAEPYVRKPININFDDRGRLWVTESVEYPFPAKPGTRPRDTVRILQDTNGDGLADEVTTFADGLNIPIGVLPVTKGAIVYSIPNVYRLYDTDGDDRADRREVLLGTYGFKDTHGMTGEFTWGFDGWIYACHGFANTSTVKARDGSTITMQSGNTYRFKPDGSRVEQFTHGQVNPFGLTFDPLGNLYSCDCHTRPVMMLLRGGYYQSFGKPDDGLGFAPEMCDHDHGSTAIAGITYYAADHFPPQYRDTVFIGNVVTNRINHDRLERHGSTYVAIQQPDFLTSDDPWFRPVDIKLGPDGALYVADFYNRIIGHYEVPLTHPGRDRERGRIWRIVYRGMKAQPARSGALPSPKVREGEGGQPHADWSKATVAELVQDLAHPNLVVRMKATNQLVERGGQAAVKAVSHILQTDSSPFQRMHGLWVLERLAALDDAAVEKAAKDRHSGVRVHAMRILAERRELSGSMHQLVLAGLKDADAFVQRAAADALGTHPAPANIRPLLDLRHAVPADDTHLLYVVRWALRNQLQPLQNWAPPPDSSWTRRDWQALAEVATGVPTPVAAAFLMSHLEHLPEGHANELRYVYHIARYGESSLTEKLLKFVSAGSGPLRQQADLLKAMEQGTQARGGSLNEAAKHWGEELAKKLLASKQPGDVMAGIELGGSLKVQGTTKILMGIVMDKKVADVQRATALNALVAMDPPGQIPLVGRLLADASEPVALREKAATALAGINQPAAQAELLKSLESAPERLALAIAAGLAGNRHGADKLLEAVAAGKASPRLLQERPVELNLSRANPPAWKDRLAKLTAGLPPADKRLQDLLKHRRAGFVAAKTDAVQGAKVFEKNCANCHQIANQGAKIGPQLDGVGIRGVDRLLEDVLDPSRNVDQAFRLTTLNLRNGQMVSGLLLREEGEVLVVADAQGKEVRVPKKAVEERTVSQLSPMPANFADQIPEPDFYNLLAYLLDQKPAGPNPARDANGPSGR